MSIDPTIVTLNQETPGGATWEIGGTLNIDVTNGGTLTIDGRQESLQASITAAAGTTNQTLVTIQFKDGAGTNMTRPLNFDWVLSDASSGAGLTATTASGTVGAGSSGTDLLSMVSKKAGRAQTDATGKYILAITDTGKTQFYVVVDRPKVKAPVTQILTANYG